MIAACDGQGFGHIALCPETMGKINQLGDLDEVLELCTLDERLIPCIDFGHLYARSLGGGRRAEAFGRMLDRVGCHRTFVDDGGFGPDWALWRRRSPAGGGAPLSSAKARGLQGGEGLEIKKNQEEMLAHQEKRGEGAPSQMGGGV